VNYPKKPALKKVSAIDGEQALTLISQIDDVQGIDPGQSTTNATTSITVTGTPYSMSVSNVPYSPTKRVTSNLVTFPFSKYSYPFNATNAYYQFTAKSVNATGTFTIDSVTVICGSYSDGYYYGLDITPMSAMNFTVNNFASLEPNVDCFVSFTGRCTGTAVGGGPCSYSLSNWTGKQYYNY